MPVILPLRRLLDSRILVLRHLVAEVCNSLARVNSEPRERFSDPYGSIAHAARQSCVNGSRCGIEQKVSRVLAAQHQALYEGFTSRVRIPFQRCLLSRQILMQSVALPLRTELRDILRIEALRLVTVEQLHITVIFLLRQFRVGKISKDKVILNFSVACIRTVEGCAEAGFRAVEKLLRAVPSRRVGRDVRHTRHTFRCLHTIGILPQALPCDSRLIAEFPHQLVLILRKGQHHCRIHLPLVFRSVAWKRFKVRVPCRVYFGQELFKFVLAQYSGIQQVPNSFVQFLPSCFRFHRRHALFGVGVGDTSIQQILCRKLSDAAVVIVSVLVAVLRRILELAAILHGIIRLLLRRLEVEVFSCAFLHDFRSYLIPCLFHSACRKFTAEYRRICEPIAVNIDPLRRRKDDLSTIQWVFPCRSVFVRLCRLAQLSGIRFRALQIGGEPAIFLIRKRGFICSQKDSCTVYICCHSVNTVAVGFCLFSADAAIP